MNPDAYFYQIDFHEIFLGCFHCQGNNMMISANFTKQVIAEV